MPENIWIYGVNIFVKLLWQSSRSRGVGLCLSWSAVERKTKAVVGSTKAKVRHSDVRERQIVEVTATDPDTGLHVPCASPQTEMASET